MTNCLCEYVDVGVGSILAVPHPECPDHTADVLTAMTYMRHEAERSVGVTPTRTHWAHENCPCGCGQRGADVEIEERREANAERVRDWTADAATYHQEDGNG